MALRPGLAVIIYELIRTMGLEALGIVVLAAGTLQLLAGVFRLGQWFRAVSPAVIKGMLAGIGVLIFASQFHVMVDDKPKGSGLENLITIPRAVAKSFAVPEDNGQESRAFHKRALQQVAEIHRKQIDLRERVGERFPHPDDSEAADTNEQKATEQENVERLVETQAAIRSELATIVDQLRESEKDFAGPERTAAVEAAAGEAVAQNEAALRVLQNGEPGEYLAAQDEAVGSLEELLANLKNHHMAAHLGVLAIVVIAGWHFVPKKIQAIPGPLAAVLVATCAAAALSLPVFYVEIPDRLWDGVHFPSLAVLLEADPRVLIQAAILVAAVASAETLLCATAVDQLHDGPRTNYDRELFSQGVGNIVCGVLGVLPMTGVIVRSSANIRAGGRTRLSAVLHGVWLLLFVVAFGFLLRQIPTACLAAILVYTGFKLVNPKDIRGLAKYGKSEVAIYFVTVTMIVVTDLLTGVIVGILLAALKLLYTFSHLEVRLSQSNPEHRAQLQLFGAATFIRLPVLAAELEKVPQGTELHVDFQHLDYIDHACLELLMDWAKRHEGDGGQLVIDWESLHSRFQSTARRTAAPRGVSA